MTTLYTRTGMWKEDETVVWDGIPWRIVDHAPAGASFLYPSFDGKWSFYLHGPETLAVKRTNDK